MEDGSDPRQRRPLGAVSTASRQAWPGRGPECTGRREGGAEGRHSSGRSTPARPGERSRVQSKGGRAGPLGERRGPGSPLGTSSRYPRLSPKGRAALPAPREAGKTHLLGEPRPEQRGAARADFLRGPSGLVGRCGRRLPKAKSSPGRAPRAQSAGLRSRPAREGW